MISTWSSHDAHAVLYVREKRAQHHVWMSGRHGDVWHGNSLEGGTRAGSKGGFVQAPLGSPRGFFAGVSAGVSAGSPGVSAGSPRQFSWGLRGVSGVLRGSPRQGGTQNIIEHSYVHETPHAQKPYVFQSKCPHGVCQGDCRAPRDVCCSFLEKRPCSLPLKLKKRKRRV